MGKHRENKAVVFCQDTLGLLFSPRFWFFNHESSPLPERFRLCANNGRLVLTLPK